MLTEGKDRAPGPAAKLGRSRGFSKARAANPGNRKTAPDVAETAFALSSSRRRIGKKSTGAAVDRTGNRVRIRIRRLLWRVRSTTRTSAGRFRGWPKSERDQRRAS